MFVPSPLPIKRGSPFPMQMRIGALFNFPLLWKCHSELSHLEKKQKVSCCLSDHQRNCIYMTNNCALNVHTLDVILAKVIQNFLELNQVYFLSCLLCIDPYLSTHFANSRVKYTGQLSSHHCKWQDNMFVLKCGVTVSVNSHEGSATGICAWPDYVVPRLQLRISLSLGFGPVRGHIPGGSEANIKRANHCSPAGSDGG